MRVFFYIRIDLVRILKTTINLSWCSLLVFLFDINKPLT